VIRRAHAGPFSFHFAIGFEEAVKSNEAPFQILETVEEIFDVLLEFARSSGGNGQAGWTAAPAQSAMGTSHSDVPPVVIFGPGCNL